MRPWLQFGVAWLATVSLGACAIPNLVLPAASEARDVKDLVLPWRAEWVELPLAEGEILRGVWVPADDGAPVILHLMEATVAATQTDVVHELFWQSLDAGWSVLALDYRGVGASGGARSTEHVRADARAMWNEAVRRAGGDPSRVILRGGSLGTLAAATLLQDGARPGAVVLYGPVRSQSVVKHFLVTGWAGVPRFPTWAAEWVAMFVRQPLAVDLGNVIENSAAPVLVLCAAHDELLPPDEAEDLRSALKRGPSGSIFWVEEETHVSICTRHHALHEPERAFLTSFVAPRLESAARLAAWRNALDPALRERLEQNPEALAAFSQLAVGRFSDSPTLAAELLLLRFDSSAVVQLLDTERARRGAWLTGMDEQRLQQTLDLADSAGPLPLAGLLLASRILASLPCLPLDAILLEPAEAPSDIPQLRARFGDAQIVLIANALVRELLELTGDADSAEASRRASRLLRKAAGLAAP